MKWLGYIIIKNTAGTCLNSLKYDPIKKMADTCRNSLLCDIFKMEKVYTGILYSVTFLKRQQVQI